MSFTTIKKYHTRSNCNHASQLIYGIFWQYCIEKGIDEELSIDEALGNKIEECILYIAQYCYGRNQASAHSCMVFL